jgi:hypothetical protein
MPMAVVLTVDELRALRRVVGVWLPRFVVEDDEEDLRVDLAALRGLAARDLLVLQAEDENAVVEPALDAALEAVLAPFRDPALVVEVERKVDGRSAWFGAGQTGDSAGIGLMAWHSPGLVRVELVDADMADATARLCDIHMVTHMVTTVVDSDELAMDPDALIDADELALAGASDPAVAALVAGGASKPTLV